MPLTLLDHIDSNTNGPTSWVSASVTFPAAQLAVLMLGLSDGTAAPTGIAVSDDSGDGVSWTVVATETDANTAFPTAIMAIKWFAAGTTCIVTTSWTNAVKERMGFIGTDSDAGDFSANASGVAAAGFTASIDPATSGNLTHDGDVLYSMAMVATDNSGAGFGALPSSPWAAITLPSQTAAGEYVDTVRHRMAGFVRQVLTGGSGSPASAASYSWTGSAYGAALIAALQPAGAAAPAFTPKIIAFG